MLQVPGTGENYRSLKPKDTETKIETCIPQCQMIVMIHSCKQLTAPYDGLLPQSYTHGNTGTHRAICQRERREAREASIAKWKLGIARAGAREAVQYNSIRREAAKRSSLTGYKRGVLKTTNSYTKKFTYWKGFPIEAIPFPYLVNPILINCFPLSMIPMRI